jgi:hypothetical protein
MENAIQIEKQQTPITVTRRTVVTYENVDFVTAKLIDMDHPCLKSLGLDSMDNNAKRKNLKNYLIRECIQDEVPLICLCEGACILNSKLTYYGKMAIHLLQHQAKAAGLPLFVRAEMKYTLDNLKTIIKNQGEFEETSYANSFKEIPSMTFALLSREDIYASEFYDECPPLVLVPTNSYNISGAIGTLFFDNGESVKTHLQISRHDTKLKITINTKNGNSYEKQTPYSKYPKSMIYIKFIRKGLQEFYGHQISKLNFDDDIEKQDDNNNGGSTQMSVNIALCDKDMFDALVQERKDMVCGNNIDNDVDDLGLENG